MWDDVHHIKIAVKSWGTCAIHNPGIVPVKLRKVGQEIHRNKLIELLESRDEERILILAGRSRCPKVATDIKVRNPSKEHDCFDEQEKRIRVLRRVPDKDVWCAQVLGVAWNC